MISPSSFLPGFFSRNLFTRSEMKLFLSVAFPMIVSQSIDTLMFFTDRIFLSLYKENQGEVYLNATLIGGLSSYFIMSLFIVSCAYTTALTSHSFGAKKHHQCARIGAQSFYFALFSYPVLLLTLFVVPSFYRYLEYNPFQTSLQIQYTKIILYGSIFTVLRSGISGFFIGIGKSKVVMISSIIALVVNVPCNYILIYGIGPAPELGIEGAALASVLSVIVGLLIQLSVYFGKKIHAVYRTRTQLAFRPFLFKKLIQHGFPQGISGFIGIGVFNYFILVMNSFGPVVGSAVTIAINWDSVFFVPMLGAEFSATSLVGRHMGANDLYAAKRVVRTALFFACFYAVIVIVCFLLFTDPFIHPFTTKMENASLVLPLARVMLRTACIYLLADAAHLCYSGALRGAGDTKASMYIFLFCTAVFMLLIYVLIETRIVGPLGAWYIFIGFAISLGVGMMLRYAQGKWKHLSPLARE